MQRPRTRPSLRRTLRGLVAVALVPLVLAALAGCGGGTPATPRTTTITITPTPTGGTSPATTPSTTSPSSSTTTAPSTPPTTYDQAAQHLAAGKVDAAAKPQFTSPTGNIYCSVTASGSGPAGCELRDGRVQPPAGTCDSGGAGASDVGRIEWNGDTPTPVCNSDTMIQPGVPVLQYGAIATAPGSPIQCVSEQIGMTCVDTSAKKGFFLAKGTYLIF